MRTDEELKTIAKDLQAGRIFSDRHCRSPNDLPLVFMPLGLMGKEDVESLGDVNFVFEYLDKAGPRSVNGMPMFFSFQYLTTLETEKMFIYYKKICDALEGI